MMHDVRTIQTGRTRYLIVNQGTGCELNLRMLDDETEFQALQRYARNAERDAEQHLRVVAQVEALLRQMDGYCVECGKPADDGICDVCHDNACGA